MRHSRGNEYLGLKAGDAMVVCIYLLGIFVFAGFGGLLLEHYAVIGALLIGVGVIWTGATLFVIDLLVRDGSFNRGTGR